MIEMIGKNVRVASAYAAETWSFASEAEARAKVAFVEEALTWVGTPFRDCADVKGPNGGVDCAMLLVRCGVDTGLRAPFDPRPYPPRHMMHSSEERFLGWVVDKLGGREVGLPSSPGLRSGASSEAIGQQTGPRFGDLVIWRFGRVFAHGGIIINSEECVHAYAKAGRCVVSRLDDPFLSRATLRGVEYLRPVKFFDVLTPP